MFPLLNALLRLRLMIRLLLHAGLRESELLLIIIVLRLKFLLKEGGV
jgi:hypothetical protein